MTVSKTSFLLAVRNIAQHGDTDVFPYPLENHWFHDEEAAVIELLESIDQDFERWISNYPVVFVNALAGVGYSGFRAATQVDPIWNAYLLALVIEIAPDLEAARVQAHRQVVFSYRYSPSTANNTLFDPDLGWNAYHTAANAQAQGAEVIVSTDISDFYPRVYHHRLENAIAQATTNKEAVRRIMRILSQLSTGGKSYGLPVGGNASRMLAEILLNRSDRLLISKGIRFVRFVDDYIVFAESRETAQSALVNLSEVLLENEGLTLSRSKTRSTTRAEFLRSSPIAGPAPTVSPDESEIRKFLRLRLRFDPYSPTADEDYLTLRQEIQRFNVAKMLAREMGKSRVDERLVRQLVKSIRFMTPDVQDAAVLSLLDNVNVLYPVFPTVAILLKNLLPTLTAPTCTRVFDVIRELIQRGSHITLVPTNLGYGVRLLAMDKSEETDALFIHLYEQSKINMMLKRDIILAMTRRRVDYWLSDVIKHFSMLTPWEKRALIPASYVLADEGRHWRERIRDQLSEVDRKFMLWVGTKNNGRQWEVPL
jgi:hypothetical protein